MKTKLLKSTLHFQKVVLSILVVLTLGSIACFLVSRFIPDAGLCNALMCFILGEVILPVRAIVVMIANSLNSYSAMMIIGVVASIVFLIIINICIIFLSKKKLNKKSQIIGRVITSIILLAFFAFAIVSFAVEYKQMSSLISSIGALSVPSNAFLSAVGVDFVIIKYFVVSGVILLGSLLTIIITFLCREKGKPKEKLLDSGVLFYSSFYLENNSEKEEQIKKTEQQEQLLPKVKPKKQSQELISRIMHLNKLRDAGQISDVEYTKLRQKTIKRYKG